MARGRHSKYPHAKADVIPVKGNPLDQSPADVRSARISAVYRDHQNPVKVHDCVGPLESLRAKILKTSLFPNLHNRSTVIMSD